MPKLSTIRDVDGSVSLTFSCGDLPVDSAISLAGHEPNGYFWEGLAGYVTPELASRVELDSEAGMFAAYGEPEVLGRLQTVLEGYLADAERVRATIVEAERSGYAFDD